CGGTARGTRHGFRATPATRRSLERLSRAIAHGAAPLDVSSSLSKTLLSTAAKWAAIGVAASALGGLGLRAISGDGAADVRARSGGAGPGTAPLPGVCGPGAGP